MSPEKNKEIIEDQNQEIAELKEAVAQADALADMKSNFLATMSHEIRTPMQTIYGLLELIAEEKPNEKISTMVGIAKDSASGLLEILDDVLDFAKMDADKMELDVFEVPVRLLVRGILEALSVKVRGLDVQLIDDIEKDVPFVVIGDPKRLRQIIMNLCGNAIKFTKSGSVTVHVTSETKHVKAGEGEVALRFEVIDTGIGMSKKVCDKLFGAFTQADSSTQRKFGGTGLGLSISKKLVELMGGKIGVESTEGVGSTFWFEIPTKEVDVNATTVEFPDLDGISVLSVEDHPQGAKEIVNSLQSMGASVESCPTLEEGLALIKRRPFDVAIIDQGLPDGLGLDLLKKIAELRPNTGLIMYTVRDDAGLQHTLNAMGVTYLTKPASRAGLGETVKDNASKAAQMELDGPRKLLIAEDTDSVRYVLRQQLDNIGADADFVTNGQEALDAIKTGKYGILATDLHMPEVDGYGVIEAIRESEKKSGKHMPVIVMTADVQMAQRQVYMEHGFDECMLKPISLGRLRGLMLRWGIVEEQDFIDIQEAQREAPSGDTDASAAIDIEAIKAQFGAFDESTVQMLHMFVDFTSPLIAELKAAHAAGDTPEVAEKAHSLKGAARSACCNALGDVAAKLQDDAEGGSYDDGLIAQIDVEFERFQEELKGLKV